MSQKYDGQDQTHGLSIEYIDSLYSYALVLTRNHAEAEDLVQETYVRAIPAAKGLRAGSNIKAWLFTILRNLWLNELRKMRRNPQTYEIETDSDVVHSIPAPSRNSHDLYVSKLEAEKVRAAIQLLPALFREVIVLREYEDMSYEEIASMLNCPVGTVMSRLGRARTKLRTLLIEEGSNLFCLEQAAQSDGLRR